MSEVNTHTVAHVLGEITWLLSQTPAYKNLKISDLEHTIMPALLLKQFRIFYDDSKKPVGFAVWAYLSEAIAAKIKADISAKQPIHLPLEAWKSGPTPWLMELVSPFATAENKLFEKLLTQLGDTVFKGKHFHYFLVNAKTGAKSLAAMDPKDMAHA